MTKLSRQVKSPTIHVDPKSEYKNSPCWRYRLIVCVPLQNKRKSKKQQMMSGNLLVSAQKIGLQCMYPHQKWHAGIEHKKAQGI
eukprot:CAMPEP_0119101304 /NCGR_PEP_ID=MMETSP1180-20130426/398_1 /TAXON_ID=3052 ORGANISM="Chlamydomonas cf sp, Strain CCMP681" /NCGR_SAMPLE_ID=MMETSP1180 /ASSEMBLY_ACC=CAM_ASM_000741 /LENGTH=83 /DNA_ID=CAMNT_0007085413 /DNA_START=106 /DNA_END=357 /DNA_ORIENTATION=+